MQREAEIKNFSQRERRIFCLKNTSIPWVQSSLCRFTRIRNINFRLVRTRSANISAAAGNFNLRRWLWELFIRANGTRRATNCWLKKRHPTACCMPRRKRFKRGAGNRLAKKWIALFQRFSPCGSKFSGVISAAFWWFLRRKPFVGRLCQTRFFNLFNWKFCSK